MSEDTREPSIRVDATNAPHTSETDAFVAAVNVMLDHWRIVGKVPDELEAEWSVQMTENMLVIQARTIQ